MKNANLLLLKFGDRIRQLRFSKGWSQEKLGELCNLDRTYISSLERGQRNVSLRNLAALASAFGLSLSELLNGVNGE